MTPYGYRICHGKAQIDDTGAKALLTLFGLYLAGWSIRFCAAQAQIPYSVAARALSNPVYLGTAFYPAILDQKTYDAVQRERAERACSQNGAARQKGPAPRAVWQFRLRPGREPLPAGQDRAAWLYEQIETGPADAPARGYAVHMSRQARSALHRKLTAGRK